MTNFRYLIFLIILAAWIAPAHAKLGDQGVWALRVVEMTKDGENAAHATLVVDQAERQVKVGEAFSAGVLLSVPSRHMVKLESSNGNTLTLFGGAQLRVSSGSGIGEEYGLEKGKITCFVRKALDFFNVRYRRFQAIVRGTHYSIHVEPKKSISFSVTEGSVVVERQVKVKADDGKREEIVRLADPLDFNSTKDKPKVYRLDVDEYLDKFKNYEKALEYFSRQLEKDRASGDSYRLSLGLHQMGIILRVLSRYQEALGYFQEGLKLAQERHGNGPNVEIAVFHLCLGACYGDLGGAENLNKAIASYKAAMTIYEQLYAGGMHGDIAACRCKLAMVYRNLGGRKNLEQSLQEGQLALAIYRNLNSEGVEREVAQCHVELGLTYGSLGGEENLKAAIREYQTALEIYRKVFKDDLHSEVAACRINLGNAYRGLDGAQNLKLAASHYETALTINKKLFPDGLQIDITLCHNNLGGLFWSLGGAELDKALHHYESAWSILKQLFPTGWHREMAACRLGMGNVYYLKGDSENLQKALGYFEAALEIYLQLFPDGQHLDVASCHIGLGNGFFCQGQWRRALQYYHDALRITRQLFPDGVHNLLAVAQTGLGFAYSKLQNPEDQEQAITHLQAALALRHKLFPNGQHGEIAICHYGLGEAYWHLAGAENLERAAEHFGKALEIYQQLNSGVETDEMANCHKGLGNTLIGQRNAAAVAHYEKAIAIKQRLFPGGRSSDLACCLNNLGNARRKLGGKANVKLAIQDFQSALEIQNRRGVQGEIANVHTYLGHAYCDLGDAESLRKSQAHYENALAIFEKLEGMAPSAAHCYLGLGNVCIKQGDLERAVAYQEKARGIKR